MGSEIVVKSIEIRRNGRKFGTLWIGKKGIQWMAASGKRKWGNITWDEFNEYMNGRAIEFGPRRWKATRG